MRILLSSEEIVELQIKDMEAHALSDILASVERSNESQEKTIYENQTYLDLRQKVRDASRAFHEMQCTIVSNAAKETEIPIKVWHIDYATYTLQTEG